MKMSVTFKATSKKLDDYSLILYHFTNYLREHVKYGTEDTHPNIEEIYTEWWRLCGSYKVDPYEEDL